MNLPDHTADAKLSLWQADHILAEIGLTRERVLAMTATVPRVASIPRINDRQVRLIRGIPDKPRPVIECDPVPNTWENKCAAAKKAVALFKAGGIGLSTALQRAGLSSIYSSALRQCVAGEGPILDAARHGGPLPDKATRGSLAFCRWFLDIPSSREEDPENERLRNAMKKSNKGILALSRATGTHSTNLARFINGSRPAMRPETRAKVWAALNS